MEDQEMESPNPVARFMGDIAASFLALANALETKGVLTKAELARAAQERLLVLRETMPAAFVERCVLLQSLATEFERISGD